MLSEFTIKDSGARQEFRGGMVRDTTEGKIDFLNVRFGPMFKRWAAHLTKGREKYPDPAPGVPNWTLAEGVEELHRARQSAARHFEQWLAGETDEDHAAATFFNINVAEYVKAKIEQNCDPPADESRSSDCYDQGPDGWFCELNKGHDGDHWFPNEKYDPTAARTWPRA
ncbi:MAG: hypothetical protein KGL39_38035 [Patescibacteria group bacterium]|nr:hypothetical protein [Patescibacteria group bacterium]